MFAVEMERWSLRQWNCLSKQSVTATQRGFQQQFHSFIPLFSVYPYTGKTTDVEIIIIYKKKYLSE
jgi:hypothetical protein